ncbi:sulfatase-like hydrolase/transferase [Reichenbachiella ulvae]|uniref:Sulfatase-like hydrolase/transferase n=1 Tax=Reichenbachiella ulvae TaxID=2980104 RepID=A0ABT3CSK8_9BACT|nr:sulfatase-like hydrolase/transferase [Reichenbachiella ulvae]MCV9386691.1 sulfatase-like hydrolase/transferase [Reichenbachiella ulvae]
MNVLKTKGLLLLLCGAIAYGCQSTEKQNEKVNAEEAVLPNIVFILSDDQAYNDYSFMGHEHIQTPNIDQMADQAMTFTRGYVPTSLCSPSLASIITGRYPRHHNILGNDRVFERNKGDRAADRKSRSEAYAPVIEEFKKQVTLPEMLKEKGYLSFQSGKWWHGSYEVGGFDYGMTHGDPKRGGRHGDYGLQIGRNGMDTLNTFIDYAVEQEKPFFVWYAPFLPHQPHTAPDSLVQKYMDKAPSELVAKYWAMCEWFDITIGQLNDKIEEKGLMDNTLFVYVCDNGWVQNEDKPTYEKFSKRSPFDYGMRTPIFYKWNGKITPKMDTITLSSSIDMVPTVLSLLEMDQPDNLPGISVLDQKAMAEREAIFGEIYAHDFTTIDSSLFYQIVYTNPYKLIVPNKVRKADEVVQLYNIYEDSEEKRNLAEAKPEVVADLMQKLEEHWKN